MAYVQSPPTYERFTLDGRRVVVVRFTETEAAPASDAVIDGSKIPRVGTITSYVATLTAGTGATIQPALGRKAGWTAATQDHIGQQASAAAHIDDGTNQRYNLSSVDDLHIRSTPSNAAADHAISTEIVFVEGHF